MNVLKKFSPYVSLAALFLIVLSASLHLGGSFEFRTYVNVTNLCTVVWFLTSPMWLLPKKDGGGVP